MTQQLNAVVARRIEISPGLIVLRVVPDGWVIGEFNPGQFTVLGLPGASARCELADVEESPPPAETLIKRAYSIASSSVAREYLEFYVSLVPSGALTPRLFALQEGGRLWLGRKVTGLFTLDDTPPDKHVVLVATGTGLAPYMSMLRTHLVCGAERRYAVLHGARHSWELGYRAELEWLARRCSNFTYIPVISRPAEELNGWSGETGRVQSVWARQPLASRWGFAPDPHNCHVFLCGNPGMVDEMAATLAAQGYAEHTRKTPGQIHLERYW